MTPLEFMEAVRKIVVDRNPEHKEALMAVELKWVPFMWGNGDYGSFYPMRKTIVVYDILQTRREIAYTLIHELGHVIATPVVDFRILAQNGGHGPEWVAVTKKFGFYHPEGKGPKEMSNEDWRWDADVLNAILALPLPEGTTA